MTLRTKELGENGEKIAVRHLKKLGYRILERNYRSRIGEIDIIAEQGVDLVFVEVKTRTDTLFGSPFESVSVYKQRKLAKVAQEYISKHGWHKRPARFDVVGVHLPEADSAHLRDATIELIQNAFELS